MKLILLLLIIDLSLSSSFSQTAFTDVPSKGPGPNEKLIPSILSLNEKFSDKKQFRDVPDSEFGVPDNELPAIRSQDGTPLCQTFCATALMEYENCRQQSNKKCNETPDEKRISPVSMMMYRDNLAKTDIGAIGSIADRGDTNFFEILDKIASNSKPPFFFSEGCLPFDKFVEQKPFLSKQEVIKEFFETLNTKFETAKSDPKSTEASSIEGCKQCMEILEIFKSKFSISMGNDGLVAALQSVDFKKFLFTVIFEENLNKNDNKCDQIIMKAKPKFEHFPKMKTTVSLDDTMEMMLKKIKTDKTPVILSALCGAKGADSGLCSNHCLMVSKVKHVKSVKTGEIIQLVKVQNSWSKDWQDRNNDGWIRLDIVKKFTYTFDDPKIEKDPPDKRKASFAHSISWIK